MRHVAAEACLETPGLACVTPLSHLLLLLIFVVVRVMPRLSGLQVCSTEGFIFLILHKSFYRAGARLTYCRKEGWVVIVVSLFCVFINKIV